jgi:alpha-L-fucosidase
LFLSKNGKDWGAPISEGEFSNIRNNPVLQVKRFKQQEARYCKFVAEKEINDRNFVTIAEFGVITE